jgi:hypothetical protein
MHEPGRPPRRRPLAARVMLLVAWRLACSALLSASFAQSPPAPRPFAGDRVDQAVARAVDYLVFLQNPEGAITDRSHPTAMTALALLSMASIGHQPADPTPQGQAMRRALDYILRDDRQDDSGYFGGRDGSRMYGHGIITLTLAELVGHGADAEQDRRIIAKCQKGVDLILRSQQVPKKSRLAGGWRYAPDSQDSDLSVTVWQVMALRSAHNAGLTVPSAAVDQAVAYLVESFTGDRDPNRSRRGNAIQAGFSYQPGSNPAFATTAAGLLAMQVCGRYDAPEVAAASDELLKFPPTWNERWVLYGTYYYAQGMHQRGQRHAQAARAAVEELLLPRQSKEGFWESGDGSERNPGRVYCTTLAVLSLSVKFHYLPIYQR